MTAPRNYSVAVLGAGSGGQAMAGALAMAGYSVRLWNRRAERLDPLRNSRRVRLVGAFTGEPTLEKVTGDLSSAVRGAEVVLVVTTANAHKSLACALAPLLEDGQIVLLNPGRTGGALEVREVIQRLRPGIRVYVAEAQSLVFACRLEDSRTVRVIGNKAFVPVAALPSVDTVHVVNRLSSLFPSFTPAAHVLITSFENIGAMLHPATALFNTAAIERKVPFYFYRDMTQSVSEFLVALDRERLRLGSAYGLELVSIMDWIRKSYPRSSGDTLIDLMRSNPAYNEILGPNVLDSRFLTEDVPTGLVPFIAFGDAAGVETPLMSALVELASKLLQRDFSREGRSMEDMGLAGLAPNEILRAVNGGPDA